MSESVPTVADIEGIAPEWEGETDWKTRAIKAEAELAKYKKCNSCTEILFEHFASIKKDEFRRAAFHKEWE